MMRSVFCRASNSCSALRFFASNSSPSRCSSSFSWAACRREEQPWKNLFSGWDWTHFDHVIRLRRFFLFRAFRWCHGKIHNLKSTQGKSKWGIDWCPTFSSIFRFSLFDRAVGQKPHSFYSLRLAVAVEALSDEWKFHFDALWSPERGGKEERHRIDRRREKHAVRTVSNCKRRVSKFITLSALELSIPRRRLISIRIRCSSTSRF